MTPFILAPLALTLIASTALAEDDAITEEWVSIEPGGKEISYPVPASGELFRACFCTLTQGERICECTEPAATLDASMARKMVMDIQQQRHVSLPTLTLPVLRSAGQP